MLEQPDALAAHVEDLETHVGQGVPIAKRTSTLPVRCATGGSRWVAKAGAGVALLMSAVPVSATTCASTWSVVVQRR
jgi:hypothetical protein